MVAMVEGLYNYNLRPGHSPLVTAGESRAKDGGPQFPGCAFRWAAGVAANEATRPSLLLQDPPATCQQLLLSSG